MVQSEPIIYNDCVTVKDYELRKMAVRIDVLLTEREILSHILELDGKSTTLFDIALEVGCSRSTVKRYITKLRKFNYIDYDTNQYKRSYTITKDGIRALENE